MPARVLGLLFSLATAVACSSGKEETSSPPEPAPAVDERDAILLQEKLYSQNKEELIIRHFFNDKKNGFFVDVGASHYSRFSTTYYLDRHLGWSGIAVDALDVFRRGYERNRPRTKFLSYIVTDHSGAREPFYRIEGMIPNSSAVKEYAEHWADYAKKFSGLEGGGEVIVLEVPTITLTELLDENGVERLDLLSMDIEDGEPAALRGFDIDRFKPALVCIEAHEPVQQFLTDYMRDHRYRRIERYLEYDNLNWYFEPVGDSAN